METRQKLGWAWTGFFFSQVLLLWCCAKQCVHPTTICAQMRGTLNQGSFGYFQIFLVSSYAGKLIEAHFKYHLGQLISVENDSSLISPILCWLPASRVSQGMDSLSNLSILGLPSSLCFCDLETGEKTKGRVHGRRVVFWSGVWAKTSFSFCTFHGLYHTIRHFLSLVAQI